MVEEDGGKEKGFLLSSGSMQPLSEAREEG